MNSCKSLSRKLIFDVFKYNYDYELPSDLLLWYKAIISPPTLSTDEHYKTNKITCAPSDDSDQAGHSHWALGPKLPVECTVKTDQTVRTRMLIWVFVGRSGHFVGFVMLRLRLSWGHYGGIYIFYQNIKTLFLSFCLTLFLYILDIQVHFIINISMLGAIHCYLWSDTRLTWLQKHSVHCLHYYRERLSVSSLSWINGRWRSCKATLPRTL